MVVATRPAQHQKRPFSFEIRPCCIDTLPLHLVRVRSHIRMMRAHALCTRALCVTRTMCVHDMWAQYWFFLRKVVCKPYGFHTFLPSRAALSTRASLLAALFPATQSLSWGKLCCRANRPRNLREKIARPLGIRNKGCFGGLKRFAPCGCQGWPPAIFRRKTRFARPCTAEGHTTLDCSPSNTFEGVALAVER